MNVIDFAQYDINISDDILRTNLKQNFIVHTPNLTWKTDEYLVLYIIVNQPV